MEAIFSFYSILIYFLITIWLFCYLYKKELRKELFILGVLGVFLFPMMLTVGSSDVDEIVWRFSLVTVWDFIFAFTLAGISGTIFHVIFGKHYHKLPYRLRKKFENEKGTANFWLPRIFLLFVLFIWSVVLINFFFSVSLPSATLLSSVVFAVYMISHRHDLLMDCIWSGVLTTSVVFLASSLALLAGDVQFGITPIISDLTILSVPVDLLVWSLAFGIVLGPIYEYIRRFELE